MASGELLVQWHAHYRAVRCLALYDFLLISGSEDGSIKVWDLLTYVIMVILTTLIACLVYLICVVYCRMLDEQSRLEAKTQHIYSFNQHALPVTDVACCHGAIAVSSSEDHTCKVCNLLVLCL